MWDEEKLCKKRHTSFFFFYFSTVFTSGVHDSYIYFQGQISEEGCYILCYKPSNQCITQSLLTQTS